MLLRTHLVIGVIIGLFFIPLFNYPWILLPIVLFASMLPDIDSSTSYLGKSKVMRPVQWFAKHRGLFHSLTLCAILSISLALMYPPVAFPFFLGYSFHLIADSFSVDGIRPFWPLRDEVSGRLHVGSKVEDSLFIVLIIIAVFLGISLLF